MKQYVNKNKLNWGDIMKYEWKKSEKQYYLPKAKPELIEIPKFRYITVEGTGSPDSEFYQECIKVLFQVSYSIKMSYKKTNEDGDYSVYPLEGLYDLTEFGKTLKELDRNEFVYKLMIKQPNFITNEMFDKALEDVNKKNKTELINNLKFEQIEDGLCVQMLHIGSYKEEQITFSIMDNFLKENNLKRTSSNHREIYISDFRKVKPEDLKTVIRIKVSK